MPQSEAQKRATAKWEAQNMKKITVKIKKEIFSDFAAICAAQGKTPYAVIKDCIMQTIADYKKSEQ